MKQRKISHEDLEIKSDWYNRLSKELQAISNTLDKRERKRYRLELLSGIVRRVEKFSAICGECNSYRDELASLVHDLGNLIQFPSRESRRSYTRAVGNIVKHLKKEHKLVVKGQYMAIMSGAGIAIGMVLGSVLKNEEISPGLGTIIGIALGLYLENKAKKEDRFI